MPRFLAGCLFVTTHTAGMVDEFEIWCVVGQCNASVNNISASPVPPLIQVSIPIDSFDRAFQYDVTVESILAALCHSLLQRQRGNRVQAPAWNQTDTRLNSCKERTIREKSNLPLLILCLMLNTHFECWALGITDLITQSWPTQDPTSSRAGFGRSIGRFV